MVTEQQFECATRSAVRVHNMLRRFIALLLVFSWISLSGFDVTEDLVVPDQTEFQSSADSPIATNGPAGLLTRNIVETANETHSLYPNLLERFATDRAVYTPRHPPKISKLHKINCVLLI